MCPDAIDITLDLTREPIMARIIVTTEPTGPPDPVPLKTPLLLDESVCSVHLGTEHAAAQFIQRIAWAVIDAENAEGAHSNRLEPR